MSTVWLDGSFLDESEASISTRDTGLLHGVGLFTTMRSFAGVVQRLDQHLLRLRESCEALQIPLIPKDSTIAAAAEELLKRNESPDARLRLTVTRGVTTSDPQGVRLEPTTLLTAAAIEAYPAELYEKGMTVVAIDKQKLNPYDIQAGHKTLDYFSRLTALRDANRRGAGEALWFNVHNYLQSGSISNVFLVKAGELLTPPTSEELRDDAVAGATPYPKSNVLPGITRAVVLAAAATQSIPVRLKGLSINDLLEADEVFLTNSIMGVMPVCRVERKAIGDEKPGKLTRVFSEACRAG